MTKTFAVYAVKKTRHGGYGRRLARVLVTLPVGVPEAAIHASGHAALTPLMGAVKFTTEFSADLS